MTRNLTQKEKAVAYETMQHILQVNRAMRVVVNSLLYRAANHDQSKLESPEIEIFTEYTDKLQHLEYGSPEYDQCRAEMKEALDHHYANNTHHPEHYKSGIEDMNLLDMIEMFVDWYAASKRHNDGNLRTSIAKNQTRFGMTDQLTRIFENTVPVLEGK